MLDVFGFKRKPPQVEGWLEERQRSPSLVVRKVEKSR